MTSAYRLWGREPALWLALISTLIVASSTFGFDLSPDAQGAINASCSAGFGLLTAWFVARDGLQAAILGFFKAVLALGISFGLHWSPDDQIKVMMLATAVVAVFIRQSATAPVDEAGKHVSERSIT